MPGQGVPEGGDGPDKNPRIPEVPAGLEKRQGLIYARLLGEPSRPVADRLAVTPLRPGARETFYVQGFAALDVTVPFLGPRGPDADGDEVVPLLGHPGRIPERFGKPLIVQHHMVAGEDDHDRVLPTAAQVDRGVPHRRGRIAARRLDDQVFRRQFCQLRADEPLIVRAGDNVYPGRIPGHLQRPREGLLEEGVRAPERQELLGHLLCTLGPEPLSPAAGHDDDKRLHRSTFFRGRGPKDHFSLR